MTRFLALDKTEAGKTLTRIRRQWFNKRKSIAALLREVIQRVGQDVFRDALMTYWGGRCAVTGVAEPRLLRASHIKPWARCETDAERLDVYNGLLLAAHLDAAFDAGLVSFSDEGAILFSSQFAQEDRDALGIHDRLALSRVGGGHLPNLAWHRTFLLSASA